MPQIERILKDEFLMTKDELKTLLKNITKKIKERDDYLISEDENAPLTIAGVKTRMEESL